VSSARGQASARTRARDDEALAIHFSCHDYLFSLEIKHIDRLVLTDDVKLHETVPKSQRPKGQSTAGMVVDVDGRFFAAWDAGELLGLAPVEEAWILLWVSLSADRDVPLALRTGTCHVVHTLPDATALPAGMFAQRRAAMAGAFPATPIGGVQNSLVGIVLDPSRLWTPGELVASESLVLKMLAQ
jgi:hypothetical protein